MTVIFTINDYWCFSIDLITQGIELDNNNNYKLDVSVGGYTEGGRRDGLGTSL
jgi:hypothetical protein